MNTNAIMKTATKGLMVFGFAAAGFFILASLAKRFQLARDVQAKISQGV